VQGSRHALQRRVFLGFVEEEVDDGVDDGVEDNDAVDAVVVVEAADDAGDVEAADEDDSGAGGEVRRRNKRKRKGILKGVLDKGGDDDGLPCGVSFEVWNEEHDFLRKHFL
jgi:hypothetical protein